jgi:uncharacterized membrane protein (DUF485 family)
MLPIKKEHRVPEPRAQRKTLRRAIAPEDAARETRNQEEEDRMPQSRPERMREILADPSFRELASARARLRWSLSIVTLVMFFGFIAVISTARDTLGASVAGSALPLGLVLALAMIAIVVTLTGIYVQRSNSRFDELTLALKREFGQ